MSVKLHAKAAWGVCQCGHYNWQHDETMKKPRDPGGIVIRADGHGKCDTEGCECQQYTWVKDVPAVEFNPDNSRRRNFSVRRNQ